MVVNVRILVSWMIYQIEVFLFGVFDVLERSGLWMTQQQQPNLAALEALYLSTDVFAAPF